MAKPIRVVQNFENGKEQSQSEKKLVFQSENHKPKDMSMRFLVPRNSANPQEERISLEVVSALNLGEYAIVDRTFDTQGQESDIHRHIYRFPRKQVGGGDIVRLMTGTGNDNSDGTVEFQGSVRRLHVFYWNSNTCIWNNNGQDMAILIKYSIVDRVTIPAI